MRWREALARLRGVLRFGRSDRELRTELEFHSEMLEEQYVARGLSRSDAHRAARLSSAAPRRLPKPGGISVGSNFAISVQLKGNGYVGAGCKAHIVYDQHRGVVTVAVLLNFFPREWLSWQCGCRCDIRLAVTTGLCNALGRGCGASAGGGRCLVQPN